VYGTEFGSTVLARLRTPAIKRWREGLKLTKSGANRMMASLRAALNQASTAKTPSCRPGVCLYSCRHSYITQAIVDGLSTLDVAKLTGTRSR
jgi:hypothetical protein